MKKYLKVTVSGDAPEKQIIFYDGKTIKYDLNIHYAPDGEAMYLDITPYINLRMETDCPYEITDEMPLPPSEGRPKAHFTVPRGWNNDPNGCVFDGENWHLFYQYNPVGTGWGNMHWGHAVSKDLLHFTDCPIALYPDEFGPAFSGSAWIDTRNDAGFGKGAMLLFYTAAGGCSRASENRGFTQRLAYSVDGGKTFTKWGEILALIAPGNRDPKIVRDDEVGVYRLALFLHDDVYALFISNDLKHFEKTQEISLPGDNECPDIFPLKTEDGTKWILLGANDKYYVGDFIDNVFVPSQTIRSLHFGDRAYAAQSFNQVSSSRRVRISWCTSCFANRPFNCSMTTPVEITLKKENGEYALCLNPCKEWLDAGGEESTERFVLSKGEKRNICDIDISVEDDSVKVNGFSCPIKQNENTVAFQVISEPNAVEVYVGEGDRFFCVERV